MEDILYYKVVTKDYKSFTTLTNMYTVQYELNKWATSPLTLFGYGLFVFNKIGQAINYIKKWRVSNYKILICLARGQISLSYKQNLAYYDVLSGGMWEEESIRDTIEYMQEQGNYIIWPNGSRMFRFVLPIKEYNE